MEQKEILNALHYCYSDNCEKCAYNRPGTPCVENLIRDAANEISELQAELSMLRK